MRRGIAIEQVPTAPYEPRLTIARGGSFAEAVLPIANVLAAVIMVFSATMNQIKQLMHPRALLPLRIGGRALPDSLPAAVLGFTFLYFVCVVTLTFALLLSGLDFITAFSAIIACINNMGPGLGSVGPSTNYASLTDVQSWICILAMILGRLEIFPLLVLVTRAFWQR